MGEFCDDETYERYIRETMSLPSGFQVASTSLTFTPSERPTLEPYRMDVSALVLDRPTAEFAGMCTSNAVQGAPVRIARELLERRSARGVVVNNRIANVCAPTGEADARAIQAEFASLIGADAHEVFPVSTGIIGWSLPVAEMAARLPVLQKSLAGGTALDFARGIMTTDRYPKVRRTAVGNGSIVGFAKGAGMVEPNMATMLAFFVTDVTVGRSELRRAFSHAVDAGFNRISVDSDQSTSDMALIFASGRAGPCDPNLFADAINRLCAELADDIVRNGEGTAHVIRVTVRGLDTEARCRAAGKAVVNSPLVKTAVYGNDPNVGRIVGAIGDFASSAGVSLSPADLTISIGTHEVFRDGAFRLDREKEIHLSSYLKRGAMNPRVRGYPQHDRCVDINVDFGLGHCESVVLGSDLSDEYVHENADYRT